METIELERETEQQIDVNFDFLQQSQQERALETAKSFEWVAKETLVVLVETEHSFAEDFQLCGMKMTDWVALATSGCKHKVISFVGEDEILQVAKQHAGDFSYVAVLYNDIPLLKKQTFLDLMDYFAKRKMNVMRLERGFVFRSEYLENAQILLSGMVEKFGEEDFFVVDNAEKASHAFEVLNARIVDYHKKDGVVFFGENTIFVDVDVQIESGAIIYPNNIIKGQSYIGKNVVLESGNYIVDSAICDGAKVCQSYIKNSVVEKKKNIGPFENLTNVKV
ncbi:MAG: hypothetical protein IJX00_02545 [Clostridia bacterium]|nr:hypothetical protein [Clostridia bacterium]